MKISLGEYEKYMLTPGNMLRVARLNTNTNTNSSSNVNINITPKSNPKSKIISKKSEKLSIANQPDKLFWSFYILVYGEHDYEIDHSFKKEKDFKIESIEQLRKIKSELKGMKLRLNEIEDELLNCNKITIKSLIALCLLHKINLLYGWNRKYFELVNDPAKNVNIIMNDGNNINIIDAQNKLEYYRDNYWCIDNIMKPLKAITSYSKDELFIIINKLEIKDVTLKNTKKAMYELILEKV